MEDPQGSLYEEDSVNTVAILNHLGHKRTLETNRESVTSMIENEAQRTRVTGPASLFAVHFVKHSINQVRKGRYVEEIGCHVRNHRFFTFKFRAEKCESIQKGPKCKHEA